MSQRSRPRSSAAYQGWVLPCLLCSSIACNRNDAKQQDTSAAPVEQILPTEKPSAGTPRPREMAGEAGPGSGGESGGTESTGSGDEVDDDGRVSDGVASSAGSGDEVDDAGRGSDGVASNADSGLGCTPCPEECRVSCAATTELLRLRVGHRNDDAQEYDAGVELGSSTLELVGDPTEPGPLWLGLRFAPVALPPDSLVVSAHLEFTADETDSSPTHLEIFGERSPDPARFKSTSGDIAARPLTTASMKWTPPPWTQEGERYRTPNLAALVSEMTSQPGWSSGNPLAFVIVGEGERTAIAFDGDAEQAPVLHVEYYPANSRPEVRDSAQRTCRHCGAACTPCPRELRFAVIGDFGSDGPDEASVARLVKSWSPDFIVTAGDNNYQYGSAETIDANIGKHFHEFIGSYRGSYGAGAKHNRFWPTLGNHDWLTQEDGLPTPYLNYFTLPGNERYYEVDFGVLHLFALDSDPAEPDGISPDSIQGQWARERLSASKACWNLVVFHHAAYSSARHGSTLAMQWPLEAWGADAVIAGHDHAYERLRLGGIPYFVNGLGGRSRYAFESVLPESVVRYNANLGAMLIVATERKIRYRFISSDGTLIDDFTQAGDCK